MGTTITLTCPNCGKGFDWSTGSGFMEVEVLHCDKCGKEKEWNKFDMVTDGDLDCPCGGVFTDDAPVRCPKCRAVMDNETIKNGLVMMWD